MSEETSRPGSVDVDSDVIGSAVDGGNVQARNIAKTIHEHHHYPDTPPAFPLDNLPPPNPHFTGRWEMLTAIAAAFSQSPIILTQAIAGLGGVGKTQLALAYAYAHKGDYDLIWLLQADDPATLDGDLRQLGTVLRLPLPPADAAAARQMTLSWLNGGHKRWLLLYDNADETDARALRPYLPGGRGHVLITSRRRHGRITNALWPSAKKSSAPTIPTPPAASTTSALS